jgi:hypothetical protein
VIDWSSIPFWSRAIHGIVAQDTPFALGPGNYTILVEPRTVEESLARLNVSRATLPQTSKTRDAAISESRGLEKPAQAVVNAAPENAP